MCGLCELGMPHNLIPLLLDATLTIVVDPSPFWSGTFPFDTYLDLTPVLIFWQELLVPCVFICGTVEDTNLEEVGGCPLLFISGNE